MAFAERNYTINGIKYNLWNDNLKTLNKKIILHLYLLNLLAFLTLFQCVKYSVWPFPTASVDV